MGVPTFFADFFWTPTFFEVKAWDTHFFRGESLSSESYGCPNFWLDFLLGWESLRTDATK